MMVAREKWTSLLGLVAVLVYVVLTVVAASLYPGSASPVDVYLSDLGNADYNPDGWAFFDVAMILGGILEILFFACLYRNWREGAGKRSLRTGLIAGEVNGVSVLMAGVVPEHVNLAVHIVWSMLIFLSFLPLLIAWGLVSRKPSDLCRVASWYGFVVCVLDLGLLAALFATGPKPGAGSIMEWVAVFAFLAWVGLLSLGLLRRTPSITVASHPPADTVR